MRSIGFFIRLAPSPLAAEISAAGFCVHEAIATSEVLYLCDQYNIDCVVIDSGVEEGAARVIVDGHIALRLNRGATATDVIFALAELSKNKVIHSYLQ
jgi:hypothetical protein